MDIQSIIKQIQKTEKIDRKEFIERLEVMGIEIKDDHALSKLLGKNMSLKTSRTVAFLNALGYTVYIQPIDGLLFESKMFELRND